jgi:hypothetical protein
MSDAPLPDGLTKTARDLSEIMQLDFMLEAQAVAKADDHDMPGGDALAFLAPVASPEAWEHQYEAREALERPVDHVEDQRDEWAPPLQTLLFWSEQWRVEHGKESDRRPTIASEVGFLRQILHWAWDEELHWDAFAADIRGARVRLEDILYAGEREETGMPCLYCSALLIRKRQQNGGLIDAYECRRCRRGYTEDEYRNVLAAAYRAHAPALTGPEMSERCGVTVNQIRVWATRGKVRRRGNDLLGRRLYDVEDVLKQLETEEVAS